VGVSPLAYNMGSRLLSELEQDSFEPDEYVERLAWRATSNQNSTGTVGVSSIDEDFDAQALHEAFRIAIQDLSAMQEKQKIKCQALEQVCLLFISFLVRKSYSMNSY
jgi:hypothetical protein